MQLQKHGVIALNHDAQTAALARLDETAFFVGREDNAEVWHLAGERMLFYLKSMQLAPEDRLGLSLEAIRRAKAIRPEASEPLTACLEALWDILQERSRCAEMPKHFVVGVNRKSGHKPKAPQKGVVWPSNLKLKILSQPAIQRQHMTSAPMELSPWRKATLRAVEAARNPIDALLYRHGSFLGGLFMLLAVVALK